MKRVFATVIAIVFLLSFSVAPVFAADAVTSASATEGGSTAAAPAAPAAPAKTTEAAKVAAPAVSSASETYAVVEGDMMWTIAKKFGVTLDQLIAMNPQIKNPDLIVVGQKINVKSAVASAYTEAAGKKVYQGLGQTVTFRNGPGKDDTGVPVYSFTVVFADATFDAQGKILNAYLDAYEVATPNYDGASMPHFSGWPGVAGYNVTDHATGKVTGVSTNTLESATAEVNGWKTKRERGDTYDMNPKNEWYKQMNFYQKWFQGKTIDELDAWFAKNTTSAGRPIKADTTNDADKAKLAALSDSEKAALADVVSGATMSLKDAHGNFLGALENAYKNRVEVVIP